MVGVGLGERGLPVRGGDEDLSIELAEACPRAQVHASGGARARLREGVEDAGMGAGANERHGQQPARDLPRHPRDRPRIGARGPGEVGLREIPHVEGHDWLDDPIEERGVPADQLERQKDRGRIEQHHRGATLLAQEIGQHVVDRSPDVVDVAKPHAAGSPRARTPSRAGARNRMVSPWAVKLARQPQAQERLAEGGGGSIARNT